MNKNLIFLIHAIILLLLAPVLHLGAEQIELTELVNNALKENSDILTSGFDVTAEELKFNSVKSGNLPSIGFTTDTGNNPIYKYSNSDEFSFDSFTTERYNRHRLGGGLSIDMNIPTGGSLSATGIGSIDLSQSENSENWNYLANPSLSLYLRQPLFTDRLNGSPLRFDSLELANELAGISLSQAELNRAAVENNLILAIARTSVILNSLINTSEILNDRLELAEQRLELAYQDERAGRLSSLDRLAEELQIRRQQEALIEIDFQIESAGKDLEQLTGINSVRSKQVSFNWMSDKMLNDVDPLSNFGVLLSDSVRRSIELSGTVIPGGSEAMLEISGLMRRSGQESASTIGEAFEDAFSSKTDLSVSVALSFSAFDWGEAREKRESEKASLMAAQMRLESAEKSAQLQTAAALRNLKLIEEKFVLLQRGVEYDESLLQREQQRFEAGLTSELALDTIKLDRKEREYQIRQLNDEKSLALLELYNTGGIELKTLF